MEQKTKKRWLLIAFLSLIILSFFPALGIAGNDTSLVLGIPSAILWIGTILILLVLLSILAYRFLFTEWADKVDSKL